MNIIEFFKEKCKAADDAANTITNKMYNIPKLKDIQERNNVKLEQAKEYLQTKWILHPANATKRKEVG